MSHHCTVCGSTSGFLNTYRGLWCPNCDSYEVVAADKLEGMAIYIPPTDSAQIQELNRIFSLVDGRYEAPGAHGLAA